MNAALALLSSPARRPAVSRPFTNQHVPPRRRSRGIPPDPRVARPNRPQSVRMPKAAHGPGRVASPRPMTWRLDQRTDTGGEPTGGLFAFAEQGRVSRPSQGQAAGSNPAASRPALGRTGEASPAFRCARARAVPPSIQPPADALRAAADLRAPGRLNPRRVSVGWSPKQASPGCSPARLLIRCQSWRSSCPCCPPASPIARYSRAEAGRPARPAPRRGWAYRRRVQPVGSRAVGAARAAVARLPPPLDKALWRLGVGAKWPNGSRRG